MATVEIDRNKIKVEFRYNQSHVAGVKGMSGARFVPADKGGPHWTVPLDLANCRRLRQIFGDELKIGRELKRWASREIKETKELTTLATADDAELELLPDVLPDLYKFISTRPYQRADIKFMANNIAPANTNQPGLGKTVETIAAIFEEPGRAEGAHLISAPVTSLDVVWEWELSRWQPYPVLVASGHRGERQAVVDQAASLHERGEPFFLVVNPAMIQYRREFNKCYEHTRKKVGVREMVGCPDCEEYLDPSFEDLFSIEWNTMVVDEFHKCGLTNTTTLTAKAMNDLKVQKRMGLSGTPMGGKPIKLYGMLHFLRPDVFTSKWRFAEQWLDIEDNGYGKMIGGIKESTREEFFEMLGRYVLRRTKAEVLKQLPPKQYVPRYVPLDVVPDQKVQYREFEKLAAIKIGEEDLSATSILAEYTRLRQFSNSVQDVERKTVTNRSGEEREQLILHPVKGKSNKLAALEEIFNERGIEVGDLEGDEQVVVFSQFSEMVDMVHDYLKDKGYPVAKITGNISAKERTALVRKFQGDDPLRILVMTTTAGGVSITLDRASTAVFLDETWVPDDQEQAEDRIHRGSRNHQVIVYYIRSKDTIEDYIRDQVRDKQDLNELVLDVRRNILNNSNP